MIRIISLFVLVSCANHQNPTLKLPPGQDFYKISIGKIHRECGSKLGGHFLPIVTEAYTNGLKCLKRLPGPDARKISEELDSLMKSQKTTFWCAADGSDWQDTHQARASTSSILDKPKLGMFHPYVWINPSTVMLGSEKRGKIARPKLLELVLFHEYIHLLGWSHGDTIEKSYTCGSCCYGITGDVSLGCKICQTRYQSINDPDYIKDITAFEKTMPSKGVLLLGRGIRISLIRKKNDQKLLERLRSEPGHQLLQANAPSNTFPEITARMRKLQNILYIKGDLVRAHRYYRSADLFKDYDTLKASKGSEAEHLITILYNDFQAIEYMTFLATKKKVKKLKK